MEELKQTPPLPSRIASLVHAHFDALPTRSKPTIHPDGSREWIPMTGIVIVRGENTSSETLTCVAVTTGAKCLPASQIPRCRGLVLHDCHAEILAIRAFNYWLLNECRAILGHEKQSDLSSIEGRPSHRNGDISSPFVRRRKRKTDALDPGSTTSSSWPPFELQPDINIYMYCTCAPCGDASMELCMAAQDDPTPWELIPPKSQNNGRNASDSETPTVALLDGRGHFSLLGTVRRKPARADAESTRSKSCSDKLALRQVSSLLSYETSLLVAPTKSAYLVGVILPDEEISRVGCERSFGETGRMKALQGRSWRAARDEEDCGFAFRPFRVLSVPTEVVEALWHYGKPKHDTRSVSREAEAEVAAASKASPKKSKPGNVSAVWTVAPSFPLPSSVMLDNGSRSLPSLCKSKTGLFETIINGVRQGNRATSPLARGASCLSRAKLWELLRDMMQSSESPLLAGSNDMTEKEETTEDAMTKEKEGLLLDEAVKWRILSAPTYENFKRAPQASTESIRVRETAIKDARDVLQGWISNAGDEIWGLEVLIDPKKRKR